MRREGDNEMFVYVSCRGLF